MPSVPASRSDVLVIGAGLAGLVVAREALRAGRTVTIVDQEPAASFGGQAWWAFGGLLLVDTPEQRRFGIRDSLELARADWHRTAGFDATGDEWGRQWADAYCEWAAGDARAWLRDLGVRIFPVIAHAERGDGTRGNSVPRFHIVWGSGPGVLAPFTRAARDGVEAGLLTIRMRHRVDALVVEGGRVTGARGSVLAPDVAVRGEASSRDVVGEFAFAADHVVVATGGTGGSLAAVARDWPATLGSMPAAPLVGVPAHVDGRGLDVAEAVGANVVHRDRMWHYTEGLADWDPVWPNHGIRILPGPSSLWIDSRGDRLPAPCYPGFDTLSTLEHLRRGGHEHSWFILTETILRREIALSGSEQNPDFTDRRLSLVLDRIRHGSTGVRGFLHHGEDVVVADALPALVDGMRALEPALDAERVAAAVAERDAAIDDPDSDPQIRAIHAARERVGERLLRVAAPHRLLDPEHGPLVALRLRTLTRKSLGGIQTDLDSRVLGADGPIPGLSAVGEAAGFGGGGVHGYRSLEGTFLGGCLHTGLRAGRAIVR
ncbi:MULTISPECIES: FAD-binding dehydrogenase [unclassified Agrococcus]|uniref:FAD-binding dehydrogenase n=1 Tax=unclassified Agrococcus TaxID=2615065 RepID=UPI00361DA0C6